VRGPASWGSADVEAAIIGGVSGAATALYQTELSVCQARRRFGRYAAGWIILNSAILLSAVLLVILGVSSAFPYLLVYGVVPLLLTITAATRGLRGTDRTGATKSRAELTHHARWLLPSGVLGSFSNRVDVFIASALLVTHDFAAYAGVARFFGVFGFALTAMGTVLLPRASRLGRDTSLRSYLSAALGLIAATGLVGVVCVWQAHNVTLLLLGSAYTSAASLMPAICVAAVFLASSVTLGYLLLSVGRPGAFAFVAALVLVAKVVAALLLIPILGATGAGWSLAAGYATATFFIGIVIFVDRERLDGRARSGRASTQATSPVG
jgi:O-antigen/teichoic acid export membrane protein